MRNAKHFNANLLELYEASQSIAARVTLRCDRCPEPARYTCDGCGATLCAYCCPDHNVQLDLCDACARRPYAAPALIVRALSAAVSERN